MSEHRREIVRTQIAHVAMELFTAKGVSGTTGEEIARAIGISARTLWRYFPSKESCVRPLLTGGLDLMARRLRSWPPELSLTRYLDRSGALDEGIGEQPLALMIDLIRMTRTEPAIMSVWLEVHHSAEEVFAEAIAERSGAAPDALVIRVQAAAINVALRVAAERFALQEEPGGDLADLVREALATVDHGLGPVSGSDS